ncbi:hypothetical protein D9M71_805990 [compost metagenome]
MIEGFAGVDVLDEKHHMPDLDGGCAFVDRRGLVDPALGLPGVVAAALDVQCALAGHLQADRQAIGVGAANTAVRLDEARVVGDAFAVKLEVGIAFDAPDHFAHR